MAILRKLVVPTLVTVTAFQYFRSSNPKPNDHENNNHIVEIDYFTPPLRRLTNVFRTACYSLIDLVPLSPINLMADLINSTEVSGCSKWKVKQTAEALVLQVDVSDVAGDVKVSVEQNTDIVNGPTNSTLPAGLVTKFGLRFHVRPFECMVNHPAVLIIERKGSKEEEDSSRCLIGLPCNVYNNNAIKIEEKNKVLQVTIPKLKPRWINRVVMQQLK